ncbi:MAG: phytanoyl-CoA dioxygenase family protein, partial [Xanthobacteraceae bacterium]
MAATPMLNSTLACPPLAGTTETGTLGLYQLKRLWSRSLAARHGRFFPTTMPDRHLDTLVIHASGLGLEQTLGYLGSQAPSFEEFERWVVATAGGLAPERVARINAAIAGLPPPPESVRRIAAIEGSAPALSEADLSFWRENGYVILHDAVTPDQSAAAARAVWEHVGAAPENPETWYPANDHGIMVQYFQHPAFEAALTSPRIHKAFAQLWGTADLWVTTDRVGFNAPERDGYRFRGPHLHWDVSVKTPIPFGTGGILYLTDTPPEQGAFTLVPGFQRWGEDWLESLPRGADPRAQDL